MDWKINNNDDLNFKWWTKTMTFMYTHINYLIGYVTCIKFHGPRSATFLAWAELHSLTMNHNNQNNIKWTLTTRLHLKLLQHEYESNNPKHGHDQPIEQQTYRQSTEQSTVDLNNVNYYDTSNHATCWSRFVFVYCLLHNYHLRCWLLMIAEKNTCLFLILFWLH